MFPKIRLRARRSTGQLTASQIAIRSSAKNRMNTRSRQAFTVALIKPSRVAGDHDASQTRQKLSKYHRPSMSRLGNDSELLSALRDSVQLQLVDWAI